jgi:predicted nucleic acid-binding protein
MSVDVVFLDANILFSAAYDQRSGLLQLWNLARKGRLRLVTSPYAVEEARRHLAQPQQVRRLGRLLERMRLVNSQSEIPQHLSVDLPDKDKPIFAAAVMAGATHLLTGDFKHFGPYYGQAIGGVLILPPAWYFLRTQEKGAGLE